MRRAIAAFLAFLAVVSSGCAGPFDDGRIRSELTEAAAATREAKTMRFTFERRAISEKESEPYAGTGVADLPRRAQQFTVEGKESTAEFIEIGPSIYSFVAAENAPSIIRDTWILSTRPPARAELRELFTSPGGLPLSMIESRGKLGWPSGGDGPTVRKADTTRYTADFDPLELVLEFQEFARNATADQKRKMRAAIRGRLVVLVDGQKRVRRITVRVERTGKSAGIPVQPYVQTVEFWDFGVDAAIAPPPGEKTKTEEQLQQEAQAGQAPFASPTPPPG